MGSGWYPGASPSPGQLGAHCASALPGFDPFNAEQNIWCGLRGWNNRARRVYNRNPGLYPAPDAEFWGVTNLAMSLGEGALAKLVQVAEPRPGMVLSDIVAFVRSVGDKLGNYGIPGVGAALTAKRVMMTQVWVDAARSISGLSTYGFGVKNIPFGTGVPYREPGGGGGPMLLGAGVGLYFVLKALKVL
jgi:hypothetical protein